MITGAVEREGVSVVPPAGCVASVRVRTPELAPVADVTAAAAELRPVVHVSTNVLVDDRGDFGSGVVEQLRDRDVFVSLVELDPGQVGTALLTANGLPNRIDPARYHPDALQRTIRGQSGTQVFFSAEGRAFCLFAVLGSHARRNELAPVVDRILAGITVGPR